MQLQRADDSIVVQRRGNKLLLINDYGMSNLPPGPLRVTSPPFHVISESLPRLGIRLGRVPTGGFSRDLGIDARLEALYAGSSCGFRAEIHQCNHR